MSHLSSEQDDLHEALIDLYLSVKIRSNDEVQLIPLKLLDWHLQWRHAIERAKET
jgi:hypothetical protein